MEERGGFTLLETIITLMVLSTGLIPLVYSFTTGSHVGQEAKEVTIATNLAREKIEEIRSKPFTGLGNESLQQVAGFPDFKRQVALSVLSQESGITNLYQVDVSVQWFNDKKEVQFVTYRGDY